MHKSSSARLSKADCSRPVGKAGYYKIFILAAFAVMLAGSVAPAFAQDKGTQPADLNVIQHFVFIIKENRTFDNYFGTFPGAEGATSGKLSTGEVIPLGHTPDATPRDIGHGWTQSLAGTNHGRMDQFDRIEPNMTQACTKNDDYLCYTQLQEADIPNLFSYAHTFVLADHAFSSIHSASFPNHLYTVAAQSGGVIANPSFANSIWGCDSAPDITVQVLDNLGVLTNQYPCFNFQTLPDSLESSGISWNYYAPGYGEPGFQWSALDAIDHIRNTALWTTHVFPHTQFVSDALNGTLPAVSWLVPGDGESDHPPSSSCVGENWTVKQINAVMQGPDWNSTVIILTWDDFGGFYDHVPPPESDQFGVGLRVPMLIISPYSKSGYVSHTIYEFSSFLKLAEERFGLAPLSSRDADANDMLDSFDFTQEPLAPLVLTPRQCPIVASSQLNFPPQRVGTTSPAQLATILNPGTSVLNISKIQASGDYSQTNNCPPHLGAGKACKVNVRFTPRDTGSRTGTVAVTDNDPTSPQLVNLTGIGTNLTLSPVLLNFGARIVGRNGPAKTAILVNHGTTAVSISSFLPSGDYTQTNNCGSTLAPGSSCTLTVQFVPTTPGTRFGTVTINDSDGGTPHVLKLTGAGSFLAVSPAQLGFGSLKMGVTSSPRTFTLSNKGTAAVSVSGFAFQDLQFHNIFDYTQTNTCAGSVAANSSCTFAVTFSPLATGKRQAQLQVFTSETETSPMLVALTGIGLAAPIVSLTPASLNFSDQQLGISSPSQIVTLTNSGSAALNITNIVSSGAFSQTNTCGSSVSAGASCTISVIFTPVSQGIATGTVTISDDAANSPQSIGLTGNGVTLGVSLSPTNLAFPDQRLGTASTPQSVSLTNTGTGTLTIATIAASGDFTQTNTCGSSLAAGAICSIDVTFTPTGLGARPGSVTITDNASDSPQTASLSGNGVAPAVSLTPTSLTFPDQTAGTTSAPQAIALTNTGTASLNITSITSGGDFAQTNDCGSVLAVGLTCSISVTFTPGQTGLATGAITISDDAADSPQTVGLSGNGT